MAMNTFFGKDSETLLNELGFGQASAQEKQEMLDQLTEHFGKVVIEAVISGLNERQLRDFKEALDDREHLEERITAITAQVPGLKERIERAVADEIATIKAGRAALS